MKLLELQCPTMCAHTRGV